MGSEVYNLKTLDVENTVVRQTKPGLLNNASTNIVFDQPDLMGDEIYYGTTGIYTGERNNETEYLVQGSLAGNNFYGTVNATFVKGSTNVILVSPINDISKGDFIRNDADLNTSFYEIKSVNGTTIELYSPYTSTEFTESSMTGPCTIRKIKKSRAQFEYVKNKKDEFHIYYDSEKLSWGVTGVAFTGPINTPTGVYVFPSDDVLTATFENPATTSDPIITVVKSEAFTVVENNKSEITDIPLPAMPYPHESLKVYISKNKGTLTKAVEGKDGDYVVNYSQNPDYVFPFPPQKDRQVGYIKLLEVLNDKQSTVNVNFEGFLSIQKTSVIGSIKDLKVPVTNIIPNSEAVTVGSTQKTKNFDYTIDYGGGLVTFLGHEYNENLVGAVTYPKKLYWDGVSVMRGVGENDLVGSKVKSKNKDLVINPISGLEGITGAVYFEDTISNNLIYGDDYLVEYNSGSVRVEDPLNSDECVLVSYYVEGEDEEKESLLKKSVYRTEKFPVLPNSITLTATYTTEGKDIQRVLEENIDFEFYYLTGMLKFLGTIDITTLKKLDISYTPLAQINCILQPNADDEQTYRMTIVDDVLKIIDPFNMVFEVKNPTVSTVVSDPFKGDDDKTKKSYENTVIPGSLLRMGSLDREGFGFGGYSNEDMVAIGATGLVMEGMAKSLGVTDEYFYKQGVTGIINEFGGTGDFNISGYKYDDVSKRFTLDGTVNNVRPDLNSIITSIYSYISDVLPYAPLEAVFPVISEGATEFKIEGFDRTDVLKSGMIIRIDNFDPEQTFYFKIKSVVYDGYNTIVELYGTIPTDIRMPSFLLFDSDLNFVSLPSGTSVNNTAAIGTGTLIFKGNVLEIRRAIQKGSLLMINASEVYSVQSVEIVDNSLNVLIFPSLRSYISGSVLVTEALVYDENVETMLTRLPVLTTPEEPAFTIFYRKPVLVDGRCTIIIDTEKIVLNEYVDGMSKEYLFYFKNYNTAYQLSQDIVSTVSKYYVEYPSVYPKYYPFSLTDDGFKEEFYLNKNQ